MKVAVRRGNGLFFYECEVIPQEQHIVINEQLETKLNTLLKPDINDNYTDFIELATQEELQEFADSQIPQVISRMKFKMQLILSGISMDYIYQKIDEIEDPIVRELTRVKFEDAQEFERTDKTLNLMAQSMGLTKEQVDQIFINANDITSK